MAKVIHGTTNDNQINASADKTQVYGLKGNDTLTSDNKSDILLVGGSGNDSLIMTGGNGTLSGGAGADVFEFTYSADKPISAVIEDFVPASDKIVVNFVGDTQPQLTSTINGNDVVWKDSDGFFNLTLKSVRDNDYYDGPSSENDWDAWEAWKVLQATNDGREKANAEDGGNRPMLVLSKGLMTGASIRAQEITGLGQNRVLTNHRRPNGTNFSTVLNGKYNFARENLDGGARSVAEVMTDWMDSSVHAANILNSKFTKLGVGYNYYDIDKSDHRWYWVQLFADSLNRPETVSTANLRTAKIARSTVSKSVAGTDDANTLENDDYGVTIQGNGGNDSIINTGLNVTITGGADNDTISNAGSFVTIIGGTGDDSISLANDSKENVIQYASGDGNDTVSGFHSTDTLSILSDDEYTPATVGSDIIVSVGAGAVTLLGAANLESVNIEGTRSKHFIFTDFNNKYTNTLEGATIEALGGKDILDNDVENVLLNGGPGNDSITNGTLGTNSTLDGGEGDDTIENYAENVSILGDDGNDDIYSDGSGVKIDGGAGDDTISLGEYSENNLIKYVSGDGFDIIEGFKENDTLSIEGGSYVRSTVGNDIILVVDTDAIMLVGAAVFDSLNIIGTGSESDTYSGFVQITESNTTYRNDLKRVTISAVGNNNTISNDGVNVSISGSEGEDFANNRGDNSTIDTGEGNDSIVNSGSSVSICTGEGNDSVVNSGSSVSIDAEEGNNSIFNSGSSVSICAGGDNDNISLSSEAKDNLIEYQSGNSSIMGFNEDDTLKITNMTSECSTQTSGNDIIVNVGTESITLAGAASLESVNIIFDWGYWRYWSHSGNFITLTEGDDYIDNSGGSFVTINAGDGNNSISNWASSESSILSGMGDDTIDNSASDSVTINAGDGNNSISNWASSESSILSGTGDDYIDNSGGDFVTINADDGNNYIYNGSSDVSILSGAGDDYIDNSGGDFVTIHAGDGNNSITNWSGSESSILSGTGDDTINNSASDSVTINAGDGNNYISNWAGSKSSILSGMGDDTIDNSASDFVTILAGDGNNSITNWSGSESSILSGTGDDYIDNSGGDFVTILAGDGNNSITNWSGSESSILSGTGDDTIENDGDNVSILAGEGNDRISLSSFLGDNLILYSPGDGNDTIWGLNANSSLQIGDGTDTYSTLGSGDDLIILVGEGSITLKDARNKPPHIILGESNTSDGTSGDTGDSPSSDGRGGSDSGTGKSRGDTSTNDDSGDNSDNDITDVAGVSENISDNSNSNFSGGGNNSGNSSSTTTTSSTPTVTPETHSYIDNAAALQVETQPAPDEKLSLSFPTDWNFPSPAEIVSNIQNGQGSQLWGSPDNDTLYGTDSDDIFIGGKNQGSDTFLNVSARDIVYLSDVTLSDLSRINKEGDMVTFAFKNGNSVTIQSSGTVSGAVVLGDLTLHFQHTPQA